MRGLLHDLRFVARRLRAAPMFAFFAVLTLGLGIGVTTATYSALHRAFWRPLGIPDNAQAFWVGTKSGARVPQPRSMSSPDLRDLRANQTAFVSVQATTTFPAALFANGRSALISGEAVTGGYFTALGLRPMRGRLLQQADDDPAAPPVAVVSERLWRTHFASDEQAIGRPVKVGGRVFVLAGVASPGFEGIVGRVPITDVWVPLSTAETVFYRLRGLASSANRNRTWLRVFGRLAPDRTAADAGAQLAALGAALDNSEPMGYRSGRETVKIPRAWTTVRVGERFNPLQDEMMRAMMLVPALILLIACTNLTNLVLSRGTSRAHEFAVRRALGCSRASLVRDQLLEVGVIATGGSLAGIATAYALLSMVDAMITSAYGFWPRLRIDLSLEPSVLVAVAGAALLALLVSGLIPALELTRAKRSRALGVDSPGSAPPRWRGRSNLIALQVAASIALFLVSSLFVRQIMSTEVAKSGMNLDRSALVNVPFDTARLDDAGARQAVARVLDELRRTPGVDRAAAAVLWDRPARSSSARIAPADGRPSPGTGDLIPMTGDGFAVLGLPLRAGRTFFDTDDAGAAAVTVINEGLALNFFGTRNAVGRTLPIHIVMDRGSSVPGAAVRALSVVGVVADTYDRRGQPESKIYVPYGQHFAAEVDFIARSTSVSDNALAMSMRNAVMKVAPEVPVGYAGPASIIEGFASTRTLRLMTIIAVSLASFALLLAMGGLYGVLMHVMTQRRRELGIRAALGADQTRIRNLVLKEGIRPVLEGSIIGLGGAGVMMLVSQPMFSKPVSAISPGYTILAVIPLVLAAAVACYLPARRASNVDPNVALREL
ncbi:MAG: ABC transporter permease [Vicinamibacterales bacterium]